MFLLLVLFALLGLSLLFFIILLLVTSPKKYLDEGQSIEIVKIIDAHRKILPICSAQGWSLVTSSNGLRCWKKDLSFTVMGSPVSVYGCAKHIHCSAVTVLNVIADISTWPEWDQWAEGQTVHLEVSEDPALHGDRYMQCDQLVVTTLTMQAKPDVLMYRFGNLENNGVGWILLWNAKCLDWTFFLAQPCIDNCSSDIECDPRAEKCILTAISGSDCAAFSDKTFPDKLCAKVQNLCDAIINSHFKVRPLLPLIKTSALNNPHFPAIHSALSDLPEKPCVLLKFDRTRLLNLLQNCALSVIPCIQGGRISEFRLISRVLKDTSNGDLPKEGVLILEEKRRSRKRVKVRSDSLSMASPLIKRLQIEGRRSSSLSAPLVRKRPPELTVTQPDDEPKVPERASSHSFLDMIFPHRRSSDGSDRRSESRRSSPGRQILTKGLRRTSSTSSHEDFVKIASVHLDNEKSTIDYPLLLPDGSEPKNYKDLGELCVQSLLKETCKASLVDIQKSEEEQRQISSGWSLKELNKDVTILKRMCSVNGNCVMSYLCKGLIPASPKVVWDTLKNPLTRFMYDDTVKRISILTDYPPNQKLIHMYNESVTLLKKEVQDFCLLQTETEEENRYILTFHSVDDKLCPPMKDVVRGTVITSGWIIESVQEVPHATVLSYLMQMVISRPDSQMMEEISNIQCQCINNLNMYLSAKPPC